MLNAVLGGVGWKPEKLHRNDAMEGTALKSSFASFDVSFRALSGASSDASEEVPVSRLADYWKGAMMNKKKGVRQ